MDVLFALSVIIYSLDIIILFYFGLHSYLMIYLFLKQPERCLSDSKSNLEKLKPLRKWPMVTIQLPMFNEFYVIDRLIDATMQIDYPKKKLEIQILDDSTDESRYIAERKVKEYKKKGYNISYIHRTNRKGHKAGALKEGMEIAKGEYVAIFDSDFLPNKDFLKKTIPYFYQKDNKKIGMVQTRWGHINSDYSILTKAQSIGIDGHFIIEQVARNANDLWMNFNGTAGVWKKECIYDAGGWTDDTLTEDFDLSYRAELKGWKFQYLTDVVNPAELPATMSGFKSQQFRWCKGSIQTAVKLIPRILKSKESKKIKLEAITHLLNYTVHPLMIINILTTLPLLLFHQEFEQLSLAILFAAAFVLSIGTFGPMIFYLVSQKALYPDEWTKKIKWLPILTMIGTGVAINNTKAWIEAVIGKKSPFVRTPKLKLETKDDKVSERNKYHAIKIDYIAILEFLMAIYVTVTIIVAVQVDKLFVIPFLLLYASGFYYTSFFSLYESIKLYNQTKKKTVIETA